MEHARHNSEELTARIREMYPDIEGSSLDLSVEFSHEKDAWLVHLAKGPHELTTHLERKDADDCLEGVKCVYLGVQIAQFIGNFKDAEG
jgi:hypothetical protein